MVDDVPWLMSSQLQESLSNMIHLGYIREKRGGMMTLHWVDQLGDGFSDLITLMHDSRVAIENMDHA